MSDVMLDYSAFPDIVDAIIEYAFASPAACTTLRSVCRTFRNKIDARPLRHVLVHTYSTTHSWAGIITPWQYAEGGQPLGIKYHSFKFLNREQRAARCKLFASTAVVDVQSAYGHVWKEASRQFFADLFVNKKVILRRVMTETSKPASMPVPIAPYDRCGPSIAIDFLALYPRAFIGTPEVVAPNAPVCRKRIIHLTYDPNDRRTRHSTMRLRNSDYAATCAPPSNITIIFSPYQYSPTPVDKSAHIQGGTHIARPGGLFHDIARDFVSAMFMETNWTIVGTENISRRNLCLECTDRSWIIGAAHVASLVSRQDQLRNVI